MGSLDYAVGRDVRRTITDLGQRGAFKRSDISPGIDIHAPVISLQFQSGPVKEQDGRDGCQIEDVLQVLIDRLTVYQQGNYRCRENSIAITKMEEAKLWLQDRTRRRTEEGVEGTFNEKG